MNTPPPNHSPAADGPHRGPAPARSRRLAVAVVVAVVSIAGLDAAVDPSRSVQRSVVAAVGSDSDEDASTPSPVTAPGRVQVASAGDAAMLQGLQAEDDETGTPEPDAAPAAEPDRSPETAPAPAATPPPTTTTPQPAEPDPGVPFDEATAGLDPGGADPYARAAAAFETAVPASWRAAAPIDLQMQGGHTSLSYESGTVAVGTQQMDTWRHALYVLAHEWAHQAAFNFGTGSYLGAPPAGFPGQASTSLLQAEQFAECVAQTLVGFRWPNPYPHCPGDAMAWTANWLASGPPA